MCVTRIKSVIMFTTILSYAIMTYFNRPLFHVLNKLYSCVLIYVFQHIIVCDTYILLMYAYKPVL